MKLPSAAEMQSFDQETINNGTGSLLLMERAGKGIYDSLITRFASKLSFENYSLILCGSGNNGGDGFVIAQYLVEQSLGVKVVLVASDRYSKNLIVQIEKYKEVLNKSKQDLSESFFIFGSLKGRSEESSEIASDELEKMLVGSSLVVDALLGTGVNSAPHGQLKLIIESLNKIKSNAEASFTLIAVDAPTGVDVDTGEVFEPAVSADLTFAVELLKRGMQQYPARAYCGEIEIIEIGIDTDSGCEYQMLLAEDLTYLPMRDPDAHKGDFGQVVIIGGSKTMPGAPVLSAYSALRIGAGAVFFTSFKEAPAVLVPAELMHVVIENTKGFFLPSDLKFVKKRLATAKAVVVGPGISTEDQTGDFLIDLLKELKGKKTNILIDADALNLIAQNGLSQIDLKGTILTPHPGEMARLLAVSTQEIQRDRYHAASTLAEQTGAIVVLKGASTIIYNNGKGWVNRTGNPYMATPGSGDVLTGLIAGLLAQGLSPLEAAKLGVYLHGKGGDLAILDQQSPLIASDILKFATKSLFL